MKKSITIKTVIIIMFICALFNKGSQVIAQTYVSGIISSNTMWTLTASPYVVGGNILVDTGATLTIAAGVQVQFKADMSLEVRGTLLAKGASGNPITFTSALAAFSPGDWGYILFNRQSAPFDSTAHTGCVMQYCIVEYGGDQSLPDCNGAIRLVSAFPLIDHCTITNNSITGINYRDSVNCSGTLRISNCDINNNRSETIGSSGFGGGIDMVFLYAQTAIIKNNKISSNYTGYRGGGIKLNASHGSIENNIIVNNSAPYGLGGGISVDSAINVSDNLLFGNLAAYSGGIYADNAANINNNIFADNTTTTTDYGIISFTNNSVYTNSNFIKNTVVDNVSQTQIINDSIGGSSGGGDIMNYNTIVGNYFEGLISQSKTLYFTGNFNAYTFTGNNLFNTAGYEFYNTVPLPDNFNASGDWWGGKPSALIDSIVYDYYDNASYSIVNYSIPLNLPDTTAPITPPLNVIKKDLGSGNIQITWNKNQETDLMGYKVCYGSPTGYSFSNYIDVGTDTTYTFSSVITDTIAVTAYDKSYKSVYGELQNQLNGHESWFTNAIGKPVVNFAASDTMVCIGDTVYFRDSSLNANAWNSTWQWTFNGVIPHTSNSINPKVVYNNGGTYDVSLIVTNIAGNGLMIKTNYITVNKPSLATIYPFACNNYTSPSGNYTWTSTGIYNDTIPNSAGCDSILTIKLTISNDSYSSINPDTCNSYTSPSGNYIWTVSGTYLDTIQNAVGCDSIITINLNITTVDTSITLAGHTLTANSTGAYQWLDCNNAFNAISGEVFQSFTPTVSGSYAVRIKLNGCADTSLCYNIIIVGISEMGKGSLSIFPNPANDNLTIENISLINSDEIISIFNIQGQLLLQQPMLKAKSNIDISGFTDGVYYVKVNTEKGVESKKFIKLKVVK